MSTFRQLCPTLGDVVALVVWLGFFGGLAVAVITQQAQDARERRHTR